MKEKLIVSCLDSKLRLCVQIIILIRSLEFVLLFVCR